MADSRTTRNHDEIRKWAEERGGHPATVSGTGNKGTAGILRLDFDPPDADLKPISWDDFFDKFDREKLSFLCQDTTADGRPSRFHKFVNS